MFHKQFKKSLFTLNIINKDFFNGLKLFYVWRVLAWADILQRYKRTVIGPFWGVITTALLLLFIGPVYSKLFGQNLTEYFPYVAVSYVIWNFFSTLVVEGANSLIISTDYIKNMAWPFSVYFYRCVLRNIFVLMHNFIVLVPLLFYFNLVSLQGILLFIVGLGLICTLGFAITIVLGILSLRYRDIPQLVTNLLNMLFFLTPVLWSVNMLGASSWMVQFNPVFHVLEVLRRPLLGGVPEIVSYCVIIISIFVLLSLGFYFFYKTKKELAFWA